jgi:putative phosphoribosyl transferase
MTDPTNAQNNETLHSPYDGRLIRANAGAVDLDGIIFLPDHCSKLVILAYGIDNAESNTRQNATNLAQKFHAHKLATLVIDLFSSEERDLDRETGFFRQNTEIMQQRIIGLAEWLLNNPETEKLSCGYFGSGASGAAALIAAAERPDVVGAIVVAGGQLELARPALPRVYAPTLLLAAEKDEAAVKQNQEALALLARDKQFEQVAGVSSLFTEKSALDDVASRAAQWFERWLAPVM